MGYMPNPSSLAAIAQNASQAAERIRGKSSLRIKFAPFLHGRFY
jgi:hypothetical protein